VDIYCCMVVETVKHGFCMYNEHAIVIASPLSSRQMLRLSFESG
jgi:hypothetical protein